MLVLILRDINDKHLSAKGYSNVTFFLQQCFPGFFYVTNWLLSISQQSLQKLFFPPRLLRLAKKYKSQSEVFCPLSCFANFFFHCYKRSNCDIWSTLYVKQYTFLVFAQQSQSYLISLDCKQSPCQLLLVVESAEKLQRLDRDWTGMQGKEEKRICGKKQSKRYHCQIFESSVEITLSIDVAPSKNYLM